MTIATYFYPNLENTDNITLNCYCLDINVLLTIAIGIASYRLLSVSMAVYGLSDRLAEKIE